MIDYVELAIYIDKDKNVILVPYKVCKIGYAVATEPCKFINNKEWGNIQIHICQLLDKSIQEPIAKEPYKNIMEKICGNKSFKQFSKKHICISIKYYFKEEKYILLNEPRLSDGSYGVEKNSISEKYSNKYVSMKNENKLQEDFLKAYDDAQQYLKEIGSKL